MTTLIKTWQIFGDKLEDLETTMEEAKRREQHLEEWIKKHPKIIGEDIRIIGEQVPIDSGRLDLLGITKSGDLVIIELKRGDLPREALSQAIDYASYVEGFDKDQISSIFEEYAKNENDKKKNAEKQNINPNTEEYLIEDLEDYLIDQFKISGDIEFNSSQKIILVGFSAEASLQRMVEWLSERYNMDINVVILKFIKTKNGDEILAKTTIIPEGIAEERSQKRRMLSVSETPGEYKDEDLEKKLKEYLKSENLVPTLIREVLLPACLNKTLSREDFAKQIVEYYKNKGEVIDEAKAGKYLSSLSRVLVLKDNDFLRQIIKYDKLFGYEKTNYRIEGKFRDLVDKILKDLKSKDLNS